MHCRSGLGPLPPSPGPRPRLPLWLWLALGLLLAAPDPAQATLLVGAGSILPGGVIADAQFAYRFVQTVTQVQFYLSEAGAGKCRIMNYTAECSPTDKRAPENLDYAIGTSSFTADNYRKYPDLQMYPTLVTALVPIYNLNSSQGLALTRPTLAKIFCGQIRTWDDPEILATNPNFSSWKVPPRQPIEVVVRRETADLTIVFKRAMAAFWPNFTRYADLLNTATWGTALVTKQDGFESVNSHVLRTPWTLAFSAFNNARDVNAVQALMVQGSGARVACTLSSITYAVLEMGLSFGNNGEDPSRLTAELSNAQGVNAWPIVTYMYLFLRKSTLRRGATCAYVKENVAFWQWFLSADVMTGITTTRNFVQIPTIVRDVILQRLVNDVTCNGVRVYRVANTTEIVGAGEESLSTVFVHLARVYPLSHSNTSVTYHSLPLPSSSAAQQALASHRFVVVRQRDPQPITGTATLLFAGVALVVVSQYNLTLDGPTLIRILEGDIRTWLHPAITALNPAGLADTAGALITDPSQKIILCNGPTSSTPPFQTLMQRLSPTFTGKALWAAPYYGTEELLRYVVSGTPYALSVSVFYGDFSARLQFARLRGPTGVPVPPSADAIRGCASADVYASASNSFTLSQSANASCYFLSEAVYLIARKPACGSADEAAAAAAVDFVAWLFGDAGLAAALQDQHLAPLHDVAPAVVAANRLALQSLRCITPAAVETPVDLLPIVLGAAFGGLFAVVAPVAWYVWHSTKEMRRLRKQFSDVKVAQECAEAIACFNLDAVAWLSTVRNPSKIQQAFLNIIGLLVDVKPFIPDQLMAQLQAGEITNHRDGVAAEAEGLGNKRRKSRLEEPPADGASQSQASGYGSPKSEGSTPAHSGQRGPHSPPSDARSDASSAAGHRAGRAGPRRGAAVHSTDSMFRTCTYLFAQFHLPGDTNTARLNPRMTTVAAHVVTVAKGLGATIDRVTYDSVAVHWNGSVSAASAPTQATELALELTKTRAILPLDAQPGFRLLVGVGHGLCHVATVSAAGQRFFVVGGPEVATAVDVVMRELAIPVGCSILVTDAVQREVQYAFHCFPRLWLRDTLLWEPVEARQSAAAPEEWMYELQQREQRDRRTYSGRLLQEVFLLARNETARPAVLEHVRRIEAQYGAEMSQQDVASLRLLISSLSYPPGT